MEKCKTITVRFELPLYMKIRQHELDNSSLIRKAVVQYFRSLEPNGTLFSEDPNMSYNKNFNSLFEHYVQRIQDLEQKNETLSYMNMSWWKRRQISREQKKLLSEHVSK
jgi:hypothetical protein